MSSRFPFDAEDPFATRPDEKPPAGWDARFWEGVQERIEDRRKDPQAGRLPEPPRREGASARALAIAALVMAAAAAATALLGGALAGRPAARAPGGGDAGTTVVRVDGSGDPSVAVEWARSGGCRSGYVIFRSLAPEVSYVVIDHRLEAR